MMTLTICVANIDINSLQCKSSNSYIYQLRGCWCCCDLALPCLVIFCFPDSLQSRWAAATSACAVQRGLGLMVVMVVWSVVSRLQGDAQMLIPGHVWTMWKTISEAQPGPAVHFSFLSMCLQQWGSQPSVLQADTGLGSGLGLCAVSWARYLQCYSTTFIRCNLWGEKRGHDAIDIRSFYKKTGRIYREINKYIGPNQEQGLLTLYMFKYIDKWQQEILCFMNFFLRTQMINAEML